MSDEAVSLRARRQGRMWLTIQRPEARNASRSSGARGPLGGGSAASSGEGRRRRFWCSREAGDRARSARGADPEGDGRARHGGPRPRTTRRSSAATPSGRQAGHRVGERRCPRREVFSSRRCATSASPRSTLRFAITGARWGRGAPGRRQLPLAHPATRRARAAVHPPGRSMPTARARSGSGEPRRAGESGCATGPALSPSGSPRTHRSRCGPRRPWSMPPPSAAGAPPSTKAIACSSRCTGARTRAGGSARVPREARAPQWKGR